jgi:hypothetical protein
MHRLGSLAQNVRASIGRPFRALGRRLRPRPSGLRFVRVFRFLRPLFRWVGGLAGDLVGLVPALLAGAGVFLVVAGLFNYFGPVDASSPTPSPTVVAVGTPEPYSLPPVLTSISPGSPSPGASAGFAIATRVVVPALGIDLPIVAPPRKELYPLCDTAEYLTLGMVYAYPGAPQVTYIYAHARVHMFWQLLAHSKIRNGADMIGMWVEVYTSDNQDHIYQISQVIRHVPATSSFADKAIAADTDELWLQTSEGHDNSSGKLQVVAQPLGVVAATQAAAHPAPTGHVCPDAPVCTAAGQGGCRKA